jgi:hypothetical protein
VFEYHETLLKVNLYTDNTDSINLYKYVRKYSNLGCKGRNRSAEEFEAILISN